MRKLHLGCGTNQLSGWENYDSEVDITKILPFPSGQIDYIFIEHCLEHVTPSQAIGFLEEAHRILKPGGVIRIAVPSLPQIGSFCNDEYIRFTQCRNRREAMKKIVTHHGHQSVFDADILCSFLEIAGFSRLQWAGLYDSVHPELRGTNHHWTVIGKDSDRVETICMEGTK